MQKKRPRGKDGSRTETPGGVRTTAPATVADPSQVPAQAAPAGSDVQTPGGRPVRVRSRLVAGVAAVSLVVVAAGTPGILATSAELTESQRLVTLAALDRQAVTLAHSLSDERDEVTAYIAAGRAAQRGDKKDQRRISDSLSARVDRQIDEIRTAVPEDHAELRHHLAGIPSVRRTALTGKGTAMEAHRAYGDVIAALHALAEELAEKTPPRAAGATRAPADLGLAVERASATRGLLLAALSVPKPENVTTIDPITGLPVESEGEDSGADARTRGALTAAAQQARVRELAALADFDQAADKTARDKLSATVTGPEVRTAEGYLARLTDQPELSDSERDTDPEKLVAALTARIEQMRGAETALAADRVERFEQLRDDDVTALELRIALLGGLVIVAIGVSAAVARTLTRPLAVLRIGAARVAAAPEAEDPVRFTGRNDEFAQVVRSLNSLHGKLRDLGARAERLDSDRADLAGARDALAADVGAARAELQEHTEELSAELERLRHTVHHTFVNLSLRTLGLVERQLGIIEKLEAREQDPERLATLFKLDHMATVMRRHSENLLVLAGAEHGQGHVGPVPLVDVLRAAVSEIERYERVVIQSLPPHAQIAGYAADDLSHLVAELLENAASFSPPDAQVELSGWLLESGEVMLSVEDAGIGMTAGRIAEINERLENPKAYETRAAHEGEGLGLRVAALLAARHGVRIQLREHKQGGITAVVVIGQALLPSGPPATEAQSAQGAGTAPVLNLPGAVAEANSNALPGPRRPDPASAGGDAVADGAAEPEPAATADVDVDAEPGGDAVPDPAPAAEAERGVDEAPEVVPAPAGGPVSAEDPFVAAAERAIRAAEAERGVDEAPEVVPAPAGGPVSAEDPFVAAAERAIRAAEAERGVDEAPEVVPAPAGGPVSAEDPFVAAAERAVRAAEAERDTTERTPDAESHTAGIDQETFSMRLPQQREQTPEPEPQSEAPAASAPVGDRVTDKGLPKRTPKPVQPAAGPGERTGSIDAQELRRRLGSFHQGAKDGRRDVEAELARNGAETQHQQESEAESGDNVEEARS
ncbi:nitrate- and nitrite sensing domain-containing protein [Streptomyces sp. NPDC002187]|uniref:sensor histidine kinase n=1 Tax=Streptomyces sp. NPDC002187 TaxID=3364637 RepID=UPI0036917FF3